MSNQIVEVDSLPVYCPNPAMPAWSSHPKVFLNVAHAATEAGTAKCPYCGTEYKLKDGVVVHSH